MTAKLEGGAYLSSFVDAISEKLSSLLEHDFVLELDDSAPDLLQRLYDCLCDVGSVLDDAELKQFNDKRVKKWLVDLQDALYMADDLVDELSTKAATATPTDPGNSYDWSRPVDSIIDDSGVNNDIEKIVGRLEFVVGRKGYLRLKDSAKLDTSWRIPSTSLVVSSDIFGRDKDKENIIKLLLDDACAAESPVVIPIVGMGGIGKTTLAQLVYNDARVEKKFGTRAWVCVAENPDPIQVTRTIITEIDSCPRDMATFQSLQTNLKEMLAGKTFLFVLDDVWNDQQDMWKDFLKPFRYGNNGSKILLTTRGENVASVFATTNLHYRLSLLSEEDCWSVFLKHSSISTTSKQYATLEPIGRKIVEKCKGLALAVKTLGALLRNKYNEGDWENLLESEIWELSEDKSKIVPALRVSYHYLPSHLKRCFVYCSLFPEDYQFDKNELILLWMAEDLLQPEENNTLENIGCAYFDELVARSFFQPSNTNEKLFVMHDLMLDLASLYGEKFYLKHKRVTDTEKIDSKTRHLSYPTKYEDNVALYQKYDNRAIYMRTFLEFSWARHGRLLWMGSDCWLLQQQLLYLRAFSFRYAFMGSLPNSIGELIHLRYLNLSSTAIVTLSESICKLYNLQTLKLAYCSKLEMLPNCMQNLVNLRHLDIRGCDRLKEMPKEMSKLKHLNFLSNYIVGEQDDNGIRELGTLDDLHGLFCISKLENVKNSDEASEAKMGNKKYITTLELEWLHIDDIGDHLIDDVEDEVEDVEDGTDEDDTGDVEDDIDVQTERDILDKLQPHQNLKELSISGYRGETFPDWLGLSSYSNMTKLTLKRCKNCNELPALGQLPSLQHLEFFEFDGLEKIDFEIYNKSNGSFEQETAFKCLETLKIENMPRWREWRFPDKFDGFPRLRILKIRKCPVLSGGLPTHLPALEELTIIKCEELSCSLPRAPNLHGAVVDSLGHFSDVKLDEQVFICNTQLAMSVLEFLSHNQPPRVRFLQIIGFESAISISDYLPASLRYLRISACSNLSFSDQLQHKSITTIDVSGCDFLTFSLGDCPNLESLEFSSCERMEYVVVPQGLPSLRYLEISRCHSLVSLPALGLAAPHLQELHIEGCPEIDCFAEDCLPPSLKKLSVDECHKLTSWIASKGLQSPGLTHLELNGCNDVKSFPREACLPASLESLKLCDFPNLETLHCKGFHHLTSLKYLEIKDCPNLKNITEEHLLPSIEKFRIWENCPLIGKLKEIEGLRIQVFSFFRTQRKIIIGKNILEDS